MDKKFTRGQWKATNVPGAGVKIKALFKKINKNPLSFFCTPSKKDITFRVNEDGEMWGELAYEEWVQFDPFEGWKDMQDANGQLMATAPELLDACENSLKILQKIANGTPVYDIEGSYKKAITDLKTVIKKALSPIEVDKSNPY